jgi:hypothetical protein
MPSRPPRVKATVAGRRDDVSGAISQILGLLVRLPIKLLTVFIAKTIASIKGTHKRSDPNPKRFTRHPES